MPYAVIVTLAPPASKRRLDPLQAEDTATLLARLLARAREAAGPDGSHVGIVDRWVGTHPEAR